MSPSGGHHSLLFDQGFPNKVGLQCHLADRNAIWRYFVSMRLYLAMLFILSMRHCFNFSFNLNNASVCRYNNMYVSNSNHRLLGQNGIWVKFVAYSFIYHKHMHHNFFKILPWACAKEVISINEFVILVQFMKYSSN